MAKTASTSDVAGLIQDSYVNCDKLAMFLDEYRKTDGSKYNAPLDDIRRLFDDTWKDVETKSGHIVLKHRVTNIVINYQNHGDGTVDTGAMVDLVKKIQEHINLFYEKVLGYPTRVKYSMKPDFNKIAKRIIDEKKVKS